MAVAVECADSVLQIDWEMWEVRSDGDVFCLPRPTENEMQVHEMKSSPLE
jgi:hypothetical protein